MGNFSTPAFKSLVGFSFKSELQLSSDWKFYLALFHEEWSSVPENPAFEKLSVAYYSTFCLCFFHLSCLDLIFYQTNKYFLLHLGFKLSFPDISL